MTTYKEWFNYQQGTAYDSMWSFAKAAWDFQQIEIERLRNNLQVTEQTQQVFEELAKLRLDESERLREKLSVAEVALEYYIMGGSNYMKMAVAALAKIREVK